MLEFVKIGAAIMAAITVVLQFVGFSKLGETKIFRFVIGEFAFATAIFFAFQTALQVSTFSPYGIGIWTLVGSLNFAQATWMSE